MTLANKLTISRILLIPVMIVFIYLPSLQRPIGFFNLDINQFIFATLFVIASLTDLLDGYVARKYNQVTTFGKFLDPIADKILVIIALLYLMFLNESRVPIWAVMIVIVREFMVTGIRLLAVDKGLVIAASPYGKFKTAATMAALVVLLYNDFGFSAIIGSIYFGDLLLWIALVLTVISGADYLIKNKNIVFESI